METNVVKVKLWGMDIGYLSWDKKTGAAIFEYEPSFLEPGIEYRSIDNANRFTSKPKATAVDRK